MGGVKSLGEFYLGTLANEKDIDWVFFSPAGSLEPGEATGTYRLARMTSSWTVRGKAA